MKRFAALMLVLSACTTAATTGTTTAPVPPAAPGSPAATTYAPGAASGTAAVETFLAAVRAQDLQAMSAVFGTFRGPSRDHIERSELEKRLIILQCYFNHDKSRILGESPGEGGHRVFNVELTRGRLVRAPRFYTIQGPQGRWFVDNMEIAAVREFCRDS